MAMATGGDMVLQFLRELRDLQQQVQVENRRIDERLTGTEQRLTQMQLHLEALIETLTRDVGGLKQDFSGLRESFRITKTLHEKYFEKLGRTVNMLAGHQLQDREKLDDYGRRIIVLEQS